jgi:hypothetical protein
MPRSFRPITVTLETGATKTVTPRLRLGALAVTPRIDHGHVRRGEFVVTHVPTGLRIGHVSFPFGRACAFCRALHVAVGEALAAWTLTRVPTRKQRTALARRCYAVLASIYEAEP